MKSKILFFYGLIIISVVGCSEVKTTTPDQDHQTGAPAEAAEKGSAKSPSSMIIAAWRGIKQRALGTKTSCWDNPLADGNVLILAMGANTRGLTETNKDAQNFADAMQNLFKVDKSRVCVLKDVHKDEFEQALKRLNDEQMVGADDLVIIYFSGHGTQKRDSGDMDEKTDNCDEFLVTSKRKDEFEKAAHLQDDQFAKLVEGIPTNQILTVIDACYSEGSTKGETSNERVKSTSSEEDKLCPIHEGVELDHTKGILLSAATENQKAVELRGMCETTKEKDGNFGGRFTRFFLDALKQAKNKPEKVDLLKVFNQAKEMVYVHSDKCSETAQNPRLLGDEKLFHTINRYIP